MNRMLSVLREYKEILILGGAIAAIASPLGRHIASEPSPADTRLEMRVDSISHDVSVLVKLACLRELGKWDELDVAGIPCGRLVSRPLPTQP